MDSDFVNTEPTAGCCEHSWWMHSPAHLHSRPEERRATFQPLGPFSRKKGLRRKAEIPFGIV